MGLQDNPNQAIHSSGHQGTEPEPALVPVRLLADGVLPAYATRHSAGCDLTATTDMILRPGETKLLPLGFIMALPPDCEAQVRPRSGLSLKTTLRVPNAPGTIDADYRHEMGVILENSFHPSSLPGLIAARPALLEELVRHYRLVRLADLLGDSKRTEADPVDAEVMANPLLRAYLDQTVWVDEDGLPYGTIRIRKGDRIAQMVVATVRHAVFDPSVDPARTGHDRGGGFGSTGG